MQVDPENNEHAPGGDRDGAAVRNAALAVLVPPLVHRLNNSLAVLRGVLDLAVRERDEPHLRRALEESIRAAELLAQLSTYAKDHADRLEAVELARLLRDVHLLLEPIASHRGILFELDLRVPSALLQTSAARLRQALVTVTLALMVQATGGAARARLRISLRAVRERVHLRFAATRADAAGASGAWLAQAFPELAALLGAEGGEPSATAGRSSGTARTARALGLFVAFPATVVPPAASAGAPPATRLGLLGPADELVEELEAVLRESGHDVRRLDPATTGASSALRALDLLLVDARTHGRRPRLVEELRARGVRVALLGLPGGRVSCGHIDLPCAPDALLAFVAGELAQRRPA